MKSSLYLLDTNTVSYAVSGRSAIARQTYLSHEKKALIAVSSITEAEIRFGIERKPGASRLRTVWEDFFSVVPILPWDSAAAKAYATLRAGLNSAGKSLDLMDMLIASHALSRGAVLVSHDAAFYHLDPFLEIEDWASDL